jgi:aryl-alcohol dehydrogenase-like predicted oxidoreductase
VSNQHSAATVNKGANTNPDPTLVIHGELEEDFHIKTNTPLIPYQSTARGYFSKITGGAVSDFLLKAYDNEKTRATYKEILDLAKNESCSVQTASLLYLARSPYPVLPITSVRKTEQLADVFDAMEKI